VVFLHRRCGGRNLLLLEKSSEDGWLELRESTADGFQSNVEHLEGKDLGFGGFLIFSDDGLDVGESEDDESDATKNREDQLLRQESEAESEGNSQIRPDRSRPEEGDAFEGLPLEDEFQKTISIRRRRGEGFPVLEDETDALAEREGVISVPKDDLESGDDVGGREGGRGSRWDEDRRVLERVGSEVGDRVEEVKEAAVKEEITAVREHSLAVKRGKGRLRLTRLPWARRDLFARRRIESKRRSWLPRPSSLRPRFQIGYRRELE